jgi:hypothetical protein
VQNPKTIDRVTQISVFGNYRQTVRHEEGIFPAIATATHTLFAKVSTLEQSNHGCQFQHCSYAFSGTWKLKMEILEKTGD